MILQIAFNNAQYVINDARFMKKNIFLVRTAFILDFNQGYKSALSSTFAT
jgi:hypothetical protein